MDYTSTGLSFRIRKVLRYLQLYGPTRTLAKVRGQYHMKRTYSSTPTLRSADSASHIGLLGCGNFAFSNIAYYLTKMHGKVIRGCMDINGDRAASLAETYGLAHCTDVAEEIITDPAIDLVFVASNHASHAEYAIQVLEHGKAVHIEKPHVVTFDQLHRLCNAMENHAGKVTLGFNRPNSKTGALIKSHLHSQSGPSMLNWFVAGHEIDPSHWYFHEQEGGRILGNLCHWTDFIYQMIPEEDRYPITIRPTSAARSDCDIAVTYTFGDGSIAVITFSAKGHTFEGVRETFSAHRGDVLVNMSDFKDLTIEVVDRKKRYRPWFRDHGHKGAIQKSYEMTIRGGERFAGESIKYVWETGELFLRTKEALETRSDVVVEQYESSLVRR